MDEAWNGALDWMIQARLPIMWTAVTVLLAVASHLFIRKRMNPRAELGAGKSHVRLVGLVILAIAVVALLRIWWGWSLGESRDTDRLKTAVKIIWTLTAAAVTYLAVRAAQGALIKTSLEVESRHKVRQMTTWVGVLLFIAAAVIIWAGNISNLGTFLGFIGAGLALSLQEMLLCIAGWALLVVRKPYDIGDRIEVDGKIGDVIGISVFQTSTLEVGNWVKGEQSTGRMLIFPNSVVIRQAIYNYCKGFPFIWNEFSTIVTYESNWDKARTLMLEQAEIEADKIEAEVTRQIERMQARYAIRYEKLRPIVYVSIATYGVELTLRYLSPVRMRRATTNRISQNILRAFGECDDIDFAYQTTRIYRNPEEGKSGTGGPGKGQAPPDLPRAME
jgi:small-conductance mechanosensitive channel